MSGPNIPHAACPGCKQRRRVIERLTLAEEAADVLFLEHGCPNPPACGVCDRLDAWEAFAKASRDLAELPDNMSK